MSEAIANEAALNPPVPTPPATIDIPPAAGHPSLLRRVLRNPLGAVCIGFLTIMVLAAIFAPLITNHDPNSGSLQTVLARPGHGYLLGGDSAGRDVYSRLVYATRFSLAGAGLALIVALVLGVPAGLVAGYYRGWFDTVSAWIINLLIALPGMVVLLAARSVIGPSMWWAMVIVGVLMGPAFYRLVYSAVLAVRAELYVDAARVSGLSDARIISRHVLRVVRAPIIVQAALVTSIAIAIQAALDFLGLGELGTPTWGAMLNDGFLKIYQRPLLILWPALALGLTSVALTLLGNTLRDELDPTQNTGSRRSRRRSKARAAAQAAAIDTAAVQSAAALPAAAVAGTSGAAAATGADGSGANGSGANGSGGGFATIVHEPDEHTRELVLQPALLDVSGLTVGYGRADGGVTEVVHGVSLRVHRGEVHGLVGESGSGKTQTAFSVLGLLPQGGKVTAGSIVFDGTELAGASEKVYGGVRGKRIAYIPQEPMSNLDPAFTVGSQLTEPIRFTLKVSKREAKERALSLLERVGIPDPKRTFASYPHQISGGMAQRVLIAGAVSCEPDLIIADEPTTALDVTVQAEVLELLRDLQNDLKMGVIMVTHNFGIVADLCDWVSVMQLGRIIETGPVRSIFHDPRHEYTRSLLDSILEDADPRGPLQPTTAGASR